MFVILSNAPQMQLRSCFYISLAASPLCDCEGFEGVRLIKRFLAKRKKEKKKEICLNRFFPPRNKKPENYSRCVKETFWFKVPLKRQDLNDTVWNSSCLYFSTGPDLIRLFTLLAPEYRD